MNKYLDSNVSKSTIVIAEEGFELAEIVAGGCDAQAVTVELKHGPVKVNIIHF